MLSKIDREIIALSESDPRYNHNPNYIALVNLREGNATLSQITGLIKQGILTVQDVLSVQCDGVVGNRVASSSELPGDFPSMN